MNKLPRILYVEDNKMLCQTLQALLRELPARVEVANDGEGAMDLLVRAKQEDDQFRLLILDMWVPKSPGEEVDTELGLHLLIKLLEQQKTFQLLPLDGSVIVYTAHPNYQHCVQCVQKGAADYILKTDLETRNNNIQFLFDRCKQLLYPKESSFDALGEWLNKHQDELNREFCGKVLAVLDPDTAAEGSIPCKRIGEYAAFAGDSYEDVRDELLNDKVLRWERPLILTIPADE